VEPHRFGTSFSHSRAEAEWHMSHVRLSDALFIAVDATDDPDRTHLSVIWVFVEPPLTDRQSDEYEVYIHADGREVFSTAESVDEYTVRQPNGPKCLPICYNASSPE